MKLIEAMKQLKDLNIKAEDLRNKVGKFCADLTIHNPTYPDQKGQVSLWIQAHHDVVKEMARLRLAIQKTNLETPVTIQLDGKQVTKPIAYWIHRRRDLAGLEQQIWQKLGDLGLKEGNHQAVQGGSVTEIRIRRYFDPVERDKHIESFRAEPSIIDATLEITNAVTDLIES
jgi:hypothetical protein